MQSARKTFRKKGKATEELPVASLKVRSNDFYMYKFRTKLCNAFEEGVCNSTPDLCDDGSVHLFLCFSFLSFFFFVFSFLFNKMLAHGVQYLRRVPVWNEEKKTFSYLAEICPVSDSCVTCPRGPSCNRAHTAQVCRNNEHRQQHICFLDLFFVSSIHFFFLLLFFVCILLSLLQKEDVYHPSLFRTVCCKGILTASSSSKDRDHDKEKDRPEVDHHDNNGEQQQGSFRDNADDDRIPLHALAHCSLNGPHCWNAHGPPRDPLLPSVAVASSSSSTDPNSQGGFTVVAPSRKSKKALAAAAAAANESAAGGVSGKGQQQHQGGIIDHALKDYTLDQIVYVSHCRVLIDALPRWCSVEVVV